ncbi:hypothetical protein [Salinibacterium sp. SWN1162]|uniref:DUF7507 domain-containing protein n=1 Tax=Salinibacterium sp. SWN1162 TaxID=2792053 RepID=UPI0018CDD331|nr:hypothetical protein [Salinibacterium sp. SWN1162]MBH0010036.1 hypothetical protein [Salinibacterium sp. SWN1162]
MKNPILVPAVAPRQRAFAPKAALAVAISVALVALGVLPASAATYDSISDEVSGGSIASHLAAQELRDTWAAAVTTRGGTVPAPLDIAGPNNRLVTGVIGTTPAGTTVSVEHTMYNTDAQVTFFGVSSAATQGKAQCTGGGDTLQDGAPRPTLLQGCTATTGYSYGASSNSGDNADTRDGVEFRFSTGVLGFGAWFGDLETRTDGLGVPALLRLYLADDTLLSESEIAPSGDQSLCSNSDDGCGNESTRWVGFTADLATPVYRMVVIVGDEDATGDAKREGMSFIGPSVVDGTANLTIDKSATELPMTATNVGDLIDYSFLVTNTGTLALDDVEIDDAGAQNLSCPATALAVDATMTCTAEHAVTQGEIDAGSYTNSATVSGDAWGETVTSEADTATTAITQVPALTATQTANVSTFTAAGDTLVFTIAITNDGNTTLTAVDVATSLPGLSLDCAALANTLAPGATGSCEATLVITDQSSDLSNVATVTSEQTTALSNQSTVLFVAPVVTPEVPEVPEVPSVAGVETTSAASPALAYTGSSITASAATGALLLLVGSLLLLVRTPAPSANERLQRPSQRR